MVLTQPGAAARVAAAAAARICEDASETGGDPVAVHIVEIPDREEAKTLGVMEEIYRALDRHRVDRYDTIVGVGGGAATDLAGFVAATWLRGVEAVYVPTTLLGAVDAAIGGKTGVNREGKNQVGAFRHPRRVTISIDVLMSLPRPLLIEGMAEALKAGLIGDPGLVEILEERGLGAPLSEVVSRAVRVKAEVTSRRLLRDGPEGDPQLRAHGRPRGGDGHRHAAWPRGGGGDGGGRRHLGAEGGICLRGTPAGDNRLPGPAHPFPGGGASGDHGTARQGQKAPGWAFAENGAAGRLRETGGGRCLPR